MIAAVFIKSVSRAHLVAPHASRPDLVGRSRVRALCGRGGTVVRIIEPTPTNGVCSDCATIAVEIGGERR